MLAEAKRWRVKVCGVVVDLGGLDGAGDVVVVLGEDIVCTVILYYRVLYYNVVRAYCTCTQAG